MNITDPDISLRELPRLGTIDTEALWTSIPLTDIQCSIPLLEQYLHRHDAWTEKIRVVGLDAGIIVDYRLTPGLARLVDHLLSRPGWKRPDIFLVSDIGRKGIDGWAAVSVTSNSRPVILLGVQLVEALTEVELAFVIGHEYGHLLGYTGEWQRLTSLSFLIREFIEKDKQEILAKLAPGFDWLAIYRSIMINFRAMESRCDRLGLLLCGDAEAASHALLGVTLKNVALARRLGVGKYLAVQLPLLGSSPAAGPFAVNAGHPFVPYRLKSLIDFSRSSALAGFALRFGS